MTGRSLFLVAALVVGLALSHQVRPLNVLAYSLVGALVLARIWSWGSVRSIDVIRRLRQLRVQAGQSVDERITLTNDSILPRLWLQVEDHSTLPDHFAGRVVDLPAGGSRAWTARTVCQSRGEYFLGPTTIVGSDPLGLFVVRQTFSEKQRLLVYPRMVDLAGFALPPASQLGGNRRRTGYQQTTPHAAEVREYQPGDPLKRIHWPTTARTARLMVKEFDQDPTADVWIFLDLDGAVHLEGDDDSTEESAVTIAASLAKHFLDQSRSVGLIASSARPVVLPPDRGDRQLVKVLEELAVVHADGDARFAEVIAAHRHRCRRGMAALAITPSLDETWVTGLRQMCMEGLRTAAVFLEPSTFGGSDSSLLMVGALASADQPTYLVKRGVPLEQALRGDGRHLAAGGALR